MSTLRYDIASQPPTKAAILEARQQAERLRTGMTALLSLAALGVAGATILFGRPTLVVMVAMAWWLLLLKLFETKAHDWLPFWLFTQMRDAFNASDEGRAYYQRVLQQEREWTMGEVTAMKAWAQRITPVLTSEQEHALMYSKQSGVLGNR